MSQYIRSLGRLLTSSVSEDAEFEHLLRQLQFAENNEDTPKGWVDPVAQQKLLLSEITSDDVTADSILKSPLDYRTLQQLRRIAACYPESLLSLNVFVTAHKMNNRSALLKLAAHCKKNMLVHISCSARLHLARESTNSFNRLPADGYAQIIVTGSDELSPLDYDFDAASNVLRLGCSDNYESLPEKVFLTYFILGQIAGVDLILKLDDDHMLGNQARFEDFMEKIERNAGVFFGDEISVPSPLQNNRCWHMGKCESDALNRKPVSCIAPTKWLNGAGGYYLKRAALVKLALVFITCEDEIQHAVYEDLLVTRVLRHLRIKPQDVSSFQKGFCAGQ